MSNYCYICNSTIVGNIFKAYDKNLCSYYCREELIQNYNFNYNFQLEKKQDILNNKTISSSKNIENDKLQAVYIEKKKSFINNNNTETDYINLSELFNYPVPILKEEKININKSYKKENPRICLNIYSEYYSDLTFTNIINNIVNNTKNLLIY